MYTLILVWSLPLIFWVRLNQMETGPNGCQHAALFVSWWNLEIPIPTHCILITCFLLFLSTSVVTLWKWWLLVGTYPLSNENPKIIRQYDHTKDSFWSIQWNWSVVSAFVLKKSCVERCGTPLTKHLRLLSLHCNAALRFWDRTPRKKLNAHFQNITTDRTLKMQLPQPHNHLLYHRWRFMPIPMLNVFGSPHGIRRWSWLPVMRT